MKKIITIGRSDDFDGYAVGNEAFWSRWITRRPKGLPLGRFRAVAEKDGRYRVRQLTAAPSTPYIVFNPTPLPFVYAYVPERRVGPSWKRVRSLGTLCPASVKSLGIPTTRPFNLRRVPA